MVAVSEEYLKTLRARPHPGFDRAQVEAAFRTALRSGLPNWTEAPGETLSRSLALMAEVVFVHGEVEIANWEQGLLIFATGTNLDIIGVDRGVLRETGEEDDDYRLRIANAGIDEALGSLTYYERRAVRFQADVVDAQAVVLANRQDVAVYALKSNHVALTPTEQAAMLSHLNDRAKKIAGVEVSMPAVTETAYTIALTIRHSAANAGDVIAADARAAIYALLADSQLIGAPVYKSALQAAAFVANVLDVEVTAPAADLPAVNGTVYTCSSDATDVVIQTVIV